MKLIPRPNPDISPCYNCGGEAEFTDSMTVYLWLAIRCKSCGTMILENTTEELIVSTWNSRYEQKKGKAHGK